MGGFSDQLRQGGRRLILLVVVSLAGGFPAMVIAGEHAWGDALIAPAPEGYSYTVSIVTFEPPRMFSTGAGATHFSEAIRVIVRGRGFRPKATGPVIWLNGIPTLRTRVADDGTSVEALFLEPLEAYEAAATKLGNWGLIYQPHEGAAQVYQVSPTGHPDDARIYPSIQRLPPE